MRLVWLHGICNTYWCVLRGGGISDDRHTQRHQTDLTTELLSAWCNWFWKNKHWVYKSKFQTSLWLIMKMHGAKEVCVPTWLKCKYQRREMSMCWTDGRMDSGIIMWYSTITKRGHFAACSHLKRVLYFLYGASWLVTLLHQILLYTIE